MDRRLLLSFILMSVISYSVADSNLEKLLDEGPGSCEAECTTQYGNNEIDSSKQVTYCCRGCRLFTILSSYERDLNQSKKECILSCGEAHETSEDAKSCSFGCDKQVESVQKSHKKLDEVKNDDALQMMYPFIYFNNWCNDMMDNMMSDMDSFSLPQVSSFSMSIFKSVDEEDGGKIVVIQSEPLLIETGGDRNFLTSYLFETNLDEINNAATPKIKPPFMNSLVQRDMNLAIFPHEEDADWLECVSEKTGLSRMFLSFVIFSCSIAIIWLCLTTVATAPEAKVETEKLSICGDEYNLDGIVKSGLESVHPKDNDDNESPLPFKVPVQKL